MRIDLLGKVLMIPAILVAFTFHEYAHARVAVKLGDNTPKYQGRLTLNPFAHIDFLGFFMILFWGFGWAKPVQVNPNALKNYYKDDLKISIAGPLANLACSIVAIIVLAILGKILPKSNLTSIINTIVYLTAYYNCFWLFLNLIPIPGFDGFHILKDLFPRQFYKISDKIYGYQLIIFILLIAPILGGGRSLLTYLVQMPAEYLFSFLGNLVGLKI
ncbi:MULTISPECIES: site-2 protease family protein [unclassified Clostridium]|uniref:site-2 protease family protein n=1 Tax=unclassified Clostridium TaxID=2614128 RepID=UPI000ED3B76F|nr:MULTISPECIES: site-2 protease family protein [unclassified Clostridium]HCQ90229.1 site-2 protease family protein [Clostridium sp.]